MAGNPPASRDFLGYESKGELVGHVSACTILNVVVKALEGSTPCYSFNIADGVYVGTGFVLVLLRDEVDDLTLLEATGNAAPTKDEAEDAAAHALILAANMEFGIVVNDFNYSEVEHLVKENKSLCRMNPPDDLVMLEKTLEGMALDAIDGCSRDSTGLVAYGAVVCGEENVLAVTAAVQEAATEFMDED